MKKLYMIFALLIFVLLVGCSSDQSEASTDNKEEQNETTNTEENKKDNEEDSQQNDRVLTEVGQTYEDELGTVELMKIKSINETIDHGPLRIELLDAKILKRTNLSNDLFNHINQFSAIAEGEGFSYIQLRFNVENTGDLDLEWANVLNLVTDQKEQVDAFAQEFLMMDNKLDYLGNVEKEFTQGYVLEKPDINEVRLVFDSIRDIATYETLVEEKDYKFSFE
ncbi:hypothetical protein [Virgibacillus salexigens]|uniref:hypothetical protein n=1 Tax=Virgibacillus TaxID=84406 RepID=UPI00136DF7CA|nr:hypothetical protein [Virgibacillus massiliensis]MYL41842.1 hypothetical protein [Virgibacillus massiliensis]